MDKTEAQNKAIKSGSRQAMDREVKLRQGAMKGKKIGESKFECNMCSKTTKHTHFR